MKRDERKIKAVGILLIFIAGTFVAFSHFDRDLDIKVNSDNFSSLTNEAGYQQLDIKIENQEEDILRPKTYLITPDIRGPVPLKIKNTNSTIKPGQEKRLNLKTESEGTYIPMEDRIDFMIVIKNQDERYATSIESNQREGFANRHFYDREYFSNWIELSTNAMNFNLDKKGYGFQADFDGCSQNKRCEILFYQRAKPEKYVDVKLHAENITNQTRIGLMAERKDEKFRYDFDLNTSKKSINTVETVSMTDIYEEAGWEYRKEFLDMGVFIFSTETKKHQVNISEINSYRTR